MTRLISLILLPILLLALSGCSWFSNKEVDPIFENLPTGTDAKVLLQQLPKGLPGDTENTRHMGSTHAPSELVLSPNGENGTP